MEDRKYVFVAQVFKETITNSGVFSTLEKAKAFAEDCDTTLETEINWIESDNDTWTWENRKGDEFVITKMLYFE